VFEYIENVINIPYTRIRNCGGTTPVFRLRYYGSDKRIGSVVSLYNSLYLDASVYLERKEAVLREFIQNSSNR
jgi:hypothetical protein